MASEAEEELLRRVARDLAFDVGDEALADALDAAAELEATYEALREPVADQRSGVGTRSDDEYDALLAVYPEPRSRDTSGALDGVTVAVKDNVAVKDLTMTCGSRSFAYVPSDDATAVERLLDAGAAVVGKANTDVWACGPTGEFSEIGRVVNPTAEGRIPGGSSSGSAAAVAGGLVDAALGTDTGGSVRIPAACCGVVGVKPTQGLVPRQGFVELAPSTDCIGPLAGDVATAREVLEAIGGESYGDPSTKGVDAAALAADATDPGDLTVGVPDSFYDAASADVRSVVSGVVDALGERVETRDVDLDLSGMEEAYPLLIEGEYAQTLAQRFVTRGRGPQYTEEWADAFDDIRFNEHVALRVLPGAYLDAKTSGGSYVVARRRALEFKEQLYDAFESVDVLVTPTMRVVPPEYGNVSAIEGMEGIYGNTGPFSLTGLPAVTVPAGTVDGVPVGAQVAAPEFHDFDALAGAQLVESVVS